MKNGYWNKRLKNPNRLNKVKERRSALLLYCEFDYRFFNYSE